MYENFSDLLSLSFVDLTGVGSKRITDVIGMRCVSTHRGQIIDRDGKAQILLRYYKLENEAVVIVGTERSNPDKGLFNEKFVYAGIYGTDNPFLSKGICINDLYKITQATEEMMNANALDLTTFADLEKELINSSLQIQSK